MARINRAMRPASCHAAGAAEAAEALAGLPARVEVGAFIGGRLSRNPSRSQQFQNRLWRRGYWTQDIVRGFNCMTQRASLPDDVL